MKLNYISSKNWSGFQFFGLDRNKVLKTSCPILKLYPPCLDMNRDKQTNNSVIVELMNIRKCGSGKTSSLLNQKAFKSQKKTIHSLAEFGSYDDVKSK